MQANRVPARGPRCHIQYSCARGDEANLVVSKWRGSKTTSFYWSWSDGLCHAQQSHRVGTQASPSFSYFFVIMFVIMYGLKAPIIWRTANSWWTNLWFKALFSLFLSLLVADLIYFPDSLAKKLGFRLRKSEVEAELPTLVGSWSSFSSASVPGRIDRLALAQFPPFSWSQVHRFCETVIVDLSRLHGNSKEKKLLLTREGIDQLRVEKKKLGVDGWTPWPF